MVLSWSFGLCNGPYRVFSTFSTEGMLNFKLSAPENKLFHLRWCDNTGNRGEGGGVGGVGGVNCRLTSL